MNGYDFDNYNRIGFGSGGYGGAGFGGEYGGMPGGMPGYHGYYR